MNTWAYNLGMIFEEICSQFPTQPALKYVDKIYTYSEVNQLANRQAVYLRQEGLHTGDVVAIVNTKKMQSYALMIACLKLGIAYTNIDSVNPVQRTEAILKQCEPKLLFSDIDPENELKHAVSKLGVPWRRLQQLSINSCNDDNNPAVKSFSGSRIAYIMFTSGSTGIPKGVAITHQNVMSFISWSKSRFRVAPTDVFANISPMYFDNSVFDFYSSLFTGASIAPIKKELLSNPKSLVEVIDMLSCSIWFSVPSMLIFLMTMRALSQESFKTLRLISFGGEGFPKAELKKLYELYGDRIELINVYGPTECTCICSSYTVTSETFQNMEGLPSLGPINPNFEYVIIDKNSQAAERGELALLGPNIGIGYFKDPERTKESFSICYDYGFYGVPMYKTGDLVFEQNGELFFKGRMDNQIKHMGYRIELEEIELALCRSESVSQAAVLYERVNRAYGKIVAFVASNADRSPSQIREELKLRLPEYMLPNTILLYDVLPKNPNGKVDKKELRRQFESRK